MDLLVFVLGKFSLLVMWIWCSAILYPKMQSFVFGFKFLLFCHLSLVTWKRGFKALIASFLYLAHKTDKYCVFRFLSFIARALCIDSPNDPFVFIYFLAYIFPFVERIYDAPA